MSNTSYERNIETLQLFTAFDQPDFSSDESLAPLSDVDELEPLKTNVKDSKMKIVNISSLVPYRISSEAIIDQEEGVSILSDRCLSEKALVSPIYYDKTSDKMVTVIPTLVKQNTPFRMSPEIVDNIKAVEKEIVQYFPLHIINNSSVISKPTSNCEMQSISFQLENLSLFGVEIPPVDRVAASLETNKTHFPKFGSNAESRICEPRDLQILVEPTNTFQCQVQPERTLFLQTYPTLFENNANCCVLSYTRQKSPDEIFENVDFLTQNVDTHDCQFLQTTYLPTLMETPSSERPKTLAEFQNKILTHENVSHLEKDYAISHSVCANEETIMNKSEIKNIIVYNAGEIKSEVSFEITLEFEENFQPELACKQTALTNIESKAKGDLVPYLTKEKTPDQFIYEFAKPIDDRLTVHAELSVPEIKFEYLVDISKTKAISGLQLAKFNVEIVSEADFDLNTERLSSKIEENDFTTCQRSLKQPFMTIIDTYEQPSEIIYQLMTGNDMPSMAYKDEVQSELNKQTIKIIPTQYAEQISPLKSVENVADIFDIEIGRAKHDLLNSNTIYSTKNDKPALLASEQSITYSCEKYLEYLNQEQINHEKINVVTEKTLMTRSTHPQRQQYRVLVRDSKMQGLDVCHIAKDIHIPDRASQVIMSETGTAAPIKCVTPTYIKMAASNYYRENVKLIYELQHETLRVKHSEVTLDKSNYTKEVSRVIAQAASVPTQYVVEPFIGHECYREQAFEYTVEEELLKSSYSPRCSFNTLLSTFDFNSESLENMVEFLERYTLDGERIPYQEFKLVTFKRQPSFIRNQILLFSNEDIHQFFQPMSEKSKACLIHQNAYFASKDSTNKIVYAETQNWFRQRSLSPENFDSAPSENLLKETEHIPSMNVIRKITKPETQVNIIFEKCNFENLSESVEGHAPNESLGYINMSETKSDLLSSNVVYQTKDKPALFASEQGITFSCEKYLEYLNQEQMNHEKINVVTEKTSMTRSTHPQRQQYRVLVRDSKMQGLAVCHIAKDIHIPDRASQVIMSETGTAAPIKCVTPTYIKMAASNYYRENIKLIYELQHETLRVKHSEVTLDKSNYTKEVSRVIAQAASVPTQYVVEPFIGHECYREQAFEYTVEEELLKSSYSPRCSFNTLLSTFDFNSESLENMVEFLERYTLDGERIPYQEFKLVTFKRQPSFIRNQILLFSNEDIHQFFQPMSEKSKACLIHQNAYFASKDSTNKIVYAETQNWFRQRSLSPENFDSAPSENLLKETEHIPSMNVIRKITKPQTQVNIIFEKCNFENLSESVEGHAPNESLGYINMSETKSDLLSSNVVYQTKDKPALLASEQSITYSCEKYLEYLNQEQINHEKINVVTEKTLMTRSTHPQRQQYRVLVRDSKMQGLDVCHIAKDIHIPDRASQVIMSETGTAAPIKCVTPTYIKMAASNYYRENVKLIYELQHETLRVKHSEVTLDKSNYTKEVSRVIAQAASVPTQYVVEPFIGHECYREQAFEYTVEEELLKSSYSPRCSFNTLLSTFDFNSESLENMVEFLERYTLDGERIPYQEFKLVTFKRQPSFIRNQILLFSNEDIHQFFQPMSEKSKACLIHQNAYFASKDSTNKIVYAETQNWFRQRSLSPENLDIAPSENLLKETEHIPSMNVIGEITKPQTQVNVIFEKHNYESFFQHYVSKSTSKIDFKFVPLLPKIQPIQTLSISPSRKEIVPIDSTAISTSLFLPQSYSATITFNNFLKLSICQKVGLIHKVEALSLLETHHHVDILHEYHLNEKVNIDFYESSKFLATKFKPKCFVQVQIIYGDINRATQEIPVLMSHQCYQDELLFLSNYPASVVKPYFHTQMQIINFISGIYEEFFGKLG